jgi:hypothetical protein
MEEVYTCSCENQTWIIHNTYIECDNCRKLYVPDGIWEAAELFNKELPIISKAPSLDRTLPSIFEEPEFKEEK